MFALPRWISGVDAATGNQKFPPIQTEQGTFWEYDGGNCGEYSPRINQGPYSTFSSNPGQPIIAGDGFAYFPYVYGNSVGVENVCNNGSTSGALHTDFHLRVLRVGTDGSSTEIKLGDWSMDSSSVNGSGTASGGIPNVTGSLITNADQGAVYSWAMCFPDSSNSCTPQYNLTTISKDAGQTTSSTTLGMNIGSMNSGTVSPVLPALQRADGSYIGTLFTFNGSSYLSPMVAFTASGQPLWSGPTETPESATSSGGVIGASGMTYDQNGSVTGQQPNQSRDSWTGNNYAISSGALVSLQLPYTDYALTFGALQGGNLSTRGQSRGTAVPPGPVIKTFFPFDIAPGEETNTQVATEFQQEIPITRATLNFYQYRDSTLTAFLAQLVNRVQAIGFIGHANPYAGQAIGLCFNPGAPNTPTNCTVTSAYKLLKPPLGYQYTIVDKFPTNASVVFIAACEVGPVLKSLWGIDESSQGQALIVPTPKSGAAVFLGHAATAWLTILDALTKGSNVHDAVDQANTAMKKQGFAERWENIGGNNVTIVKGSSN